MDKRTIGTISPYEQKKQNNNAQKHQIIYLPKIFTLFLQQMPVVMFGIEMKMIFLVLKNKGKIETIVKMKDFHLQRFNKLR